MSHCEIQNNNKVQKKKNIPSSALSNRRSSCLWFSKFRVSTEIFHTNRKAFDRPLFLKNIMLSLSKEALNLKLFSSSCSSWKHYMIDAIHFSNIIMKDSYIRYFTKQNLKSLLSYTSIVGYFILEDSDLLLASGIRDWRKLLYSTIVLPGGISFISITVSLISVAQP